MSAFDCDVLIVGAGPSGAHAARALAEAGRRVLVLDRATFPRHKPCAGGLTIKTLALVDPRVGSVIERATPRFRMAIPQRGWARDFDAGATICAFSVREKFDALNVDLMLQVGAELERVERLEAIEMQGNCVVVCVDGRAIRARYLIGADGANSRVRRLVYHNVAPRRGFAIEGLVPGDALPEFSFGEVPKGYGWLFPKGDHVNVGLYTTDDDPALSKDRLRAYAKARLGTDAVEHITGFPLGFGGSRSLPVLERIVLVGDAAGFAESLLGEGIHNAVKSGLLAAQAVIVADAGRESFGRHYRRLAKPIEADVWRCAQMARLFYRGLDTLGPAMLGFAPGRAALLKGFAAGKTMRQITNTALLAPFWRPATPAPLASS